VLAAADPGELKHPDACESIWMTNLPSRPASTALTGLYWPGGMRKTFAIFIGLPFCAGHCPLHRRLGACGSSSQDDQKQQHLALAHVSSLDCVCCTRGCTSAARAPCCRNSWEREIPDREIIEMGIRRCPAATRALKEYGTEPRHRGTVFPPESAETLRAGCAGSGLGRLVDGIRPARNGNSQCITIPLHPTSFPAAASGSTMGRARGIGARLCPDGFRMTSTTSFPSLLQ